MNAPIHHKVLILGSGPAGLTAALYTARANLGPLVVHGPLPGGQLTTTTLVENFPGFTDGIMGPDLMQVMEKQAIRFGAKINQDTISAVDLSKRPFTLKGSTNTYSCDVLIIATGASAKLLGIPGEKELMGYGVSSCATCDGAFFRGKKIMVVGGGDSACEEALFLTRFGERVYLAHRRDKLRASKIMQDRVLAHNKIEMLWNKVPVEVIGSKQDGVTAVTLEDSVSKKREKFICDAMFLGIGHEPNAALFKGLIDSDELGYLKTKPNATATNIPGVFACGDVQDHVYRQAITAAGSGCMAAIEAERWLEAQGM